MAESEDPELTELKSIIKSFVICWEGNATIGQICREYEEMEGCGIPCHKFGFHTVTEFFKSPMFREEFDFDCKEDGVEVLRLKKNDMTPMPMRLSAQNPEEEGGEACQPVYRIRCRYPKHRCHSQSILQ